MVTVERDTVQHRGRNFELGVLRTVRLDGVAQRLSCAVVTNPHLRGSDWQRGEVPTTQAHPPPGHRDVPTNSRQRGLSREDRRHSVGIHLSGKLSMQLVRIWGQRSVLLGAAKVSLVEGALLNLINQGEVLRTAACD